MNEESLIIWSLFNAVLPLIIPFLIVLFILWFTDKDQIFSCTFETFADGQLCVLAVTLSLITFYELGYRNLFLSTWSVILAVFSAIMLGLIYALNESEKTTQNKTGRGMVKTSKRKMAGISLGAAITSVISAIYCHDSIRSIDSAEHTAQALEQNHEQSRL